LHAEVNLDCNEHRLVARWLDRMVELWVGVAEQPPDGVAAAMMPSIDQ
jgi:hypothetical protein